MSCEGTCCALFGVGATLDQLRQGPAVGHLTNEIVDGDLIGFMLRELTHKQAVERQEQFGAYQGRELDSDYQFYKCIYWNEKTRLCGAYEHRPQMCREYPYPWGSKVECNFHGAGKCEHGCGCEGAPLLWDGED